MKTLVIGRSPFADILVADASVAPHHAELVMTNDGRCYLHNCAAETATWRRTMNGAEDWVPVRQGFIDRTDVVRLGEFSCTFDELLARTRQGQPERDDIGAEPGTVGGEARRRLAGRVERDPRTGEIVRRRP